MSGEWRKKKTQRPLATVVVFGLTTSTLLTLFVIPAVYGWIEEKLDPSLRSKGEKQAGRNK